MSGAMKAVTDGLFGINKAVDQFGVPRTTLKDRISGKVVRGTKSGPSPLPVWSRRRQVSQISSNRCRCWATQNKKRSNRDCAKSSDEEKRN